MSRTSISAMLSAVAAVSVVVLTTVGGKTANLQVVGIAFVCAFFVVVIGIGAGMVAAVTARGHGDGEALGWVLATLNLLLGLFSAVVFLFVGLGNSQP